MWIRNQRVAPSAWEAREEGQEEGIPGLHFDRQLTL